MSHPFWEKPLAVVTTYVSDGGKHYPKIQVTEDPLLIYFKLSRAGYGSVDEIREWDTRTVLQCLAYEEFNQKWEQAYLELNT